MSQPQLSSIQTVLFDLDGTLVDSHGDLCNALNRLEVECGKPPTPHHAIRPYVSQGAMQMICVAFGFEHNKSNFRLQSLWKQMLDYYTENIAALSTLFAGMPEVLAHLQENKIKWGIVTNKPERLAHQLLDELKLSPPGNCVIGGDTLAAKKPAPEPLLLACRLLGADPPASVYVGDDPRDVIAGKHAGMKTVAASYGYHTPDNPPDAWGADWIIDNAIELIDIIKG